MRFSWLAICLLLACGRLTDREAPRRTSTEQPETPALAKARVHLLAGSAKHTVTVDVVDSDATRERGLMYRRELDSNEGMLFLMDRVAVHSFWMRNTFLPLDIIFIDEAFRVVGTLADMRPLDETARDIGKPSLYVLEVNSGWAAKHQIEPGTLVQFDGVALP